MKIKFLQIKRVMSAALLVLLMMAGMTKMMAQTLYRQYADDGVLLNFHEIDNVDFRLFLLYNLSQDDRFVMIEDDVPGVFSIVLNNEGDEIPFFDLFESFFQNAYADFSLLTKMDLFSLEPNWKSSIPPSFFVSMMMDISLRNSRNDNYLCVNSLPFYTAETMQFEAASSSQTAQGLEGVFFDDGCIGNSYNPSWFHMEIADPGQFIIHIEGHDPNNGVGRDIDFCVWGPFTNPTTPCVAQLTADKIMDCSYSANYTENLFLGYPEAEHDHTTSHGTVNYHMPESGEYYILMLTNYSQQPCTISFSQVGGSGSSGCNGQKTIDAFVNNNGGGTVNGAGEYDCGSLCTLTATANEGYAFMDWTDENGVVVSTETQYTFSVYSDKSYTANFIQESNACYLTFNLNDSNGNGWSGNYLVLNFEDGSYQKLTVPYDMSVFSYALPIVDGSHVSLGWISGLYAEQCSFTVSYSNGNTICYASNLNNDYGFEFDVDCVEMPLTTFVITATANPIEGGIVSGGGEYGSGSTCTLTATANEGYTFMYWTENGQQVSAEAEYSFIVMRNRNLLAVFAPFSITTESNPAEGGTVSGTGEYDYGSTCTLTAIANEGYTFIYWTENGQQVSSNATYSFTVTSERNLMAHFTLPFNITATANPEEGGAITGVGEYDYGSTCTLTAIANEGYTFMYWTENGQQVSSNATYSFTVTSEHNLMAHFTLPFNITATANPEEGGAIIGVGEYNYGSTCLLIATADPGYYFVKWTENGQQVSSNPRYSFRVTHNRNLVAVFSPYCHIQASANPNEGGYVYYDKVFDFEQGYDGWGVIDANNDGYTWCLTSAISTTWTYYANLTLDWYHGGTNAVCSGSYINGVGAISPDEYLVSPQVNLGAGSSISFWVAATDPSYAADHFGVFVSDNGTSDWTLVQEWTLTGKKGGMAGGATSRDDHGLRLGRWYNYTVDLSAYAGQKYIAFRHFNCYDQYILCLDDITITSFSAEEGEYCQGQTCYLNAIPNDGYKFINWTENGEVVSTEPFYSFTVTGDRSLVANFYTNHWTSESYQNSMFMIGVVQIDGIEQASPTLELAAFCNGECRATQFPFEEGDRWLYFMDIGGNNGDEITFRLYDHSLQQELDLYCYNILPFEESIFIGVDTPYEVMFASTFTITADVNPVEGGTVLGTGDYAPGTSATLVAIPNEGYAFNCWTLDGEVVSTEPSYTFTVTESINFTANFDFIRSYQLVAGWNWWSTDLDITLDDLKTSLEAIGNTNIVIQSKDNGMATYNGTRWRGVLSTLDLSRMYLIMVPIDCEIILKGTPFNLTEHPVFINYGVNWIGFPLNQSMALADAFAGFAVNGDVVISRNDGVAAFYGTIWRGALNTLVPGQGYIYKSNAQGDRIFTFPTSAK